MKIPLNEGAAMEGYFADIGLGVGEQTTEGPPSKKKKRTGSEGEMVYKYTQYRKVFDSLSSSHVVEQIHKLLVVAVEFSDLGLVKIEAEHPVPSFDN